MRQFTPYEDFFLLSMHLYMPMKTIAKILGRADSVPRQRLHRLGYTVPAHIAAAFKQASQKKKGDVPFNKGISSKEWMSEEGIKRSATTRFKKGITPHNTKSDGEISIRKDKSGRPYKYIRISKGKWVLLQRFIWERANGKIPAGCNIRFKDGNSLNCELSNLQLVDFITNMEMNSVQRYPEPLRLTIQKIGVLNRKINKYEKQAIRPE